MKTASTLTTIAYQTPEYLTKRLEQYREAGIIAHWAFVAHKPEDKETKPHIHLLIDPAKRIDTDEINKGLTEVANGEPASCAAFRKLNDKYYDWVSYALHDFLYLVGKAEERKYHYDRGDLKSDDTERIFALYEETKPRSVADKVIWWLQRGYCYEDALRNGWIPINQLRQYERLFASCKLVLNYYDGPNAMKEVDPDNDELPF